MIVQQYMSSDPITINQEATIEQAMDLLRRNYIRHLPVVEDEKLVGWLTDANLREVLLPAMIEELTVADVMIHDPITIRVTDSVEKAAQIIVREKIGGLPVLDNGKLVGVITVVDLLNAFLQMVGILRASSRIDVKPLAGKGAVDSISRIIQELDGEIISICLLPQKSDEDPIYSFRLGKCNVEQITQAIEKEGHQVVSPAK